MRALARERKALEEKKTPPRSREQPRRAPPRDSTEASKRDRPAARIPGRKRKSEQQQLEIDALERDITELSRLSNPTDSTAADIERIRREVQELKQDFYTHLDAWQRLLLARHPQRPYTDDFIRLLFENFSEIHGDRYFADDPALIAGMAWFQGKAVMIVGSQKGRDTKQRVARNFGQAKPEGYRKALRAMQLAAK